MMYEFCILKLFPKNFLIGFTVDLGGERENDHGMALELMLGVIGIGLYAWPNDD